VRFVITLLRGLLSLALGLAVLLGGHRAQHQLANFIGIYILSTAVLTLRGWLAAGRPGLATGQSSVLGIVTGLAILGRALLSAVLPGVMGAEVLGMLALLTGWTQVLGAFDTPAVKHQLRMIESLVLGGFVLLLGAILVLFPELLGAPETFAPATAALVGWAVVGGVVLLADALHRRTELDAIEKTPLV